MQGTSGKRCLSYWDQNRVLVQARHVSSKGSIQKSICAAACCGSGGCYLAARMALEVGREAVMDQMHLPRQQMSRRGSRPGMCTCQAPLESLQGVVAVLHSYAKHCHSASPAQ